MTTNHPAACAAKIDEKIRKLFHTANEAKVQVVFKTQSVRERSSRETRLKRTKERGEKRKRERKRRQRREHQLNLSHEHQHQHHHHH